MSLFTRLLVVLLLLVTFPILAQVNKSQVERWNIKQSSRFLENKGQVTDQHGRSRNDVKFIYTAPGFKVVFKENGFSYELNTAEKKGAATDKMQNVEYIYSDKYKADEDFTVLTHRIDVELPGANKQPSIIKEGRSEDFNNYYLAHTPESGIKYIYSYNKLTYKNIWPNVDLVFYTGSIEKLKYDIILHPGANLADIQFNYNGAESLGIESGNINIQTSLGLLNESIPYSYCKETKESISVKYTKSGSGISFTAEYDKSKTLIIDPMLTWGTYFGGSGGDEFKEIEINGNFLFASGNTNSSNSIATSGAFQTKHNGVNYLDAFLTKFTISGKRMWSTYFGGKEKDYTNSLAINNSSIYIVGSTLSDSGIATSGAYQTKYNGLSEAFITKFDTSGKRIWATYFGGGKDDYGADLVLDNKDKNFYIVGGTYSSSSIATLGAHQDTLYSLFQDAYISKFDSSGKRIWSTYYGGDKSDFASEISIDSINNLYICGAGESKVNITTTGAHQTINAGKQDMFITKFDSSGVIKWGTYYGGYNSDWPYEIKTDKSGNIIITGMANSPSGISTLNSHQPSHAGGLEGFILKMNSNGVRQWSTYYGGPWYDETADLALDTSGNIFICGGTLSKSGISTNGTVLAATYEADVFIAKLDSNGKRKWGTYFGSSKEEVALTCAIDKNNAIYVAGWTNSIDSIATAGTHQTSNGGNSDAFITKFFDSDPDLGILSVNSLQSTYCGDTNLKVYIKVKNYSATLNTKRFTVGWSVNGKQMAVKSFETTVKIGDTTQLLELDTATLTIGINKIKIWTSKPDGVYDINTINDTLVKSILIYPKPKIDFSFNADICENDIVTFTNKSSIISDSIIAYYWSFGDGDTSTSTSPVKRYTKGGTYLVKLKAFTINGCSDSLSKTIIIYPRAKPDFEVNNLCSKETSQFINKSTIDSGKIKVYKWEFGDGKTSSVLNPVHQYDSAGTYIVTLTTLNNFSCTDVLKDTVTIYPAANPSFTFNNVCINDNLTFVNTSSISSGSIIKYEWKFGDGDTSYATNPTHLYAAPGSYTVQLTTITDKGCKDSIEQTVAVYQKPKALFTTTNSICLGETTAFINKSTITIGSIISYHWDFGDGDTTVLQNPTHQYSSAGQYKVLLTVTSNLGCKDTISLFVTVHSLPEAKYMVSDSTICLKDSIAFMDQSLTATEWHWDFGDSTVSTSQHPSHRYVSAGTYIVKLKIKNSSGCSDSMSRQLEIYEMPKAIFSVENICATDSLYLEDSSKGTTSWFWDFGDGYTSTLRNPSHKYVRAGTYTIYLTAQNDNGCYSSVSHSIMVDSTCVWPGDANADKVVDNKDILAIGVAYLDTGFNRTDTSTIWTGYVVKDWDYNFSSGANYKHADSDGNGTVANSDTLAVTRNYTKIHAKNRSANRGKNTDAVLKIEIQNDSLKAGDTLTAYIILGENALPAKDVYGLAFSLNYVEEYFSYKAIDFSKTWLGDNILTYSNSTANSLDIALSRIDHRNITGFGKIATMRLLIKNDAQVDIKEFKMEIVDNILISANEQKIPVNIVEDSVIIYKEPNSILNGTASEQVIKVYPNPFKDQVLVEYTLANASKVAVSLFNMNGVMHTIAPATILAAGKHQYVLTPDNYSLKSGVYFIKIEIDDIATYRKVIKIE